ncbi:acyl carrier protein [Geminicoccaceae bacterium 1502E]|uniref:Acyl carrier protein n=1 Tax=Marinimicrococcus flavescens TaxID=3031815 RepID=A0AAP3UZR0_9PROT|nr:acyl carrier protein [Marinimicrococcus flavescens]MDX6748642.1 acyl carrier protein [Geminicoccaceae bacterium 1502E]
MTTTDDTIFREICGLVARFAPAGVQLRPETELASDLNVDSVAAMDLVMEIEDKYEIDIPINQLADMRSLGDLVELVRQQLKDR